jgi:hypothetical protein
MLNIGSNVADKALLLVFSSLKKSRTAVRGGRNYIVQLLGQADKWG